jgi:hypothetical protein
VAGSLVAQFNCAEEAVKPVAFTFEMDKPLEVGGVVGPLLELTTPAQPAKPKSKIAKLTTTDKSGNPRLLAQTASPDIFRSPQTTARQKAREQKPQTVPNALWRLLFEVVEGNWTHDANEVRAGDRLSTGHKGK